MSTRALSTSLGALLVAAAIVAASRALPAQDHARTSPFVFVENTNGGDVSIIDASTLKVVGTIPVGLSPDDIVAAPAGDVLYVSRIVHRADGRPTGTGELVAIDPHARQVSWRVAFHGVPNHVAVSPDGRRVYVTVVSGNYVDVFDPAKRALVDSVDVGTGPHDIEVSRDGKTVYVGLIRGTDVTVFDAASKRVLRKIPFTANVRPIALSHDESRLYVQLSQYYGFVVADPRTGKILRRVDMPMPKGAKTPDTLPVTTNHGLRITADGRYLIANGSMTDLAGIYSLPELRLVATVPVGRDPNWVTLSPDGRRIFVSNRGSDDVSVIDLASRKEVARVKVGRYPQRMTSVALAR
ncbi:MAG TPA: cytochrome D1 domain-containing protein [Gemmatimonadaceae bacterium]